VWLVRSARAGASCGDEYRKGKRSNRTENFADGIRRGLYQFAQYNQFVVSIQN
jgi:hypothetical protein